MSRGQPLQPGDPEHVGRYRLRARLGAGGMGVAYLAEADGQQVAVKVIRPELAADPTFRARFAREAKAAAAVGGRCTAKVLDATTTGPVPFLVTEYIDGVPLDQYVTEHGPLHGAPLHALAAGLAEALVAIHAAGVIHRDLKPGNVLLTLAGPKVVDFGIASSADATTLTNVGVRVGSPGWMAPEQIAGAPDTPSLDVFAWGSLVAYAATGTNPFGTGPVDALLYRVLHEPATLPQIPGELGNLTAAALSKDPASRPSAQQLLTRLLGLQAAAVSPTAVTELLTREWRSATQPVHPAAAVPTSEEFVEPAETRQMPAASGTLADRSADLTAERRRGGGGRGALAVLAGLAVLAAVAVAVLVGHSGQPGGQSGAVSGSSSSPPSALTSPSGRDTSPSPSPARTSTAPNASDGPSPETSSDAPTETASAAPPSTAAAAGPWTTYRNDRFSYSLPVPSSFTAQRASGDGGGQTFRSSDGAAELSAFGQNNDGRQSAREFLADAISTFEAKGGTVTYRSLKPPLVAVSGTFEQDGVTSVYYQRAVVGTGSIEGFTWTYPVAAKRVYDQLLKHTAAGFRPAGLSDTH